MGARAPITAGLLVGGPSAAQAAEKERNKRAAALRSVSESERLSYIHRAHVWTETDVASTATW